MKFLRILLVTAVASAAALLGACTGTPTRSDASSATPGVTVYGTVDAGVGRVSR